MEKYTCPMHPEVVKEAPGKCPICGMQLVRKEIQIQTGIENHHHYNHSKDSNTNAKDFNKHEGHHSTDFLRKFWVCFILTIPVLTLSHTVQQWIGLNLDFSGRSFVLFALGAVIYVYGGMPFLKGMVHEIKYRSVGMMTLVALAITIAFGYSAAVTFGLRGMDFFWELATLIDIMLLGHWVEMKSQMVASKALQTLVELLPSEVNVEVEGNEMKIGLKDLKNEDIVIIRPGEKIPADGTVIDGLTYSNESMLTGESEPVKKEKGSKVIAGSINGDGAIKMKATGVGKDSYLNKVIRLVQDAQSTKSNTQNLADRVAKWLTIISIVFGIATFIYWFFSLGDLAFAVERTVTVMVTACPHALGVAIPLVVAISTAKSASNGLLIRNRTAFENTRRLSTIIFDKTGTLTIGSHSVQKVISINTEFTDDQILEYAAAVQLNSEHHIAHGIIRAAKEKGIAIESVQKFQYIPGMGVKGTVRGREIVVAGPNYLKDRKITAPEIPKTVDLKTETVVFVFISQKVVGIITLADTVRPGAKNAIAELKNLGIYSFLLTGDNETIAKSVAENLGMNGHLANVLPHEKQEKVKDLQSKGEIVAMVGDGVNDAPALAQADVGIAVGSGTDVAAETADIVLVNSDPGDVVKLIVFGKRTYNKMIQNLFWAVGYNVIAIPLAAGVLYPGFILSPALGAVLMSLSTVIVAINASLLKIEK